MILFYLLYVLYATNIYEILYLSYNTIKKNLFISYNIQNQMLLPTLLLECFYVYNIKLYSINCMICILYNDYN